MKSMATMFNRSFYYTRITQGDMVVRRISGFLSWELVTNIARYAKVTGDLIIDHIEEFPNKERHAKRQFIEKIHRTFFVGQHNQLKGYVSSSPLESSKKENQHHKFLFNARNTKRAHPFIKILSGKQKPSC